MKKIYLSLSLVLTLNSFAQYVSIPMDTLNWNNGNCSAWGTTTEGLQFNAYTAYCSNDLVASQAYNLKGSTSYIKWKANDVSNVYAAITLHVLNSGIPFASSTYSNFSLGNVFFSILIDYDTWYYTRLKIDTGGAFSVHTTTTNYVDSGGIAFDSTSGVVNPNSFAITHGFFNFVLNDTYDGTFDYMVIGEVKTNAPLATEPLCNTYDFENGLIPSSFITKGTWNVDTLGSSSMRSLHGVAGDTLFITTAGDAFISFDIKVIDSCNGGYIGFSPYNGSLYNVFDCTNTECWTHLTLPFTDTVKWWVVGQDEIWLDNINMYCTQQTTGIPRSEVGHEQVLVYPNPAHDQVFIDIRSETKSGDKLSLDLYDINGRNVWSKTLEVRSNVDVSGLNEGVYTLTIKTNDRILNKKLVILR